VRQKHFHRKAVRGFRSFQTKGKDVGLKTGNPVYTSFKGLLDPRRGGLGSLLENEARYILKPSTSLFLDLKNRRWRGKKGGGGWGGGGGRGGGGGFYSGTKRNTQGEEKCFERISMGPHRFPIEKNLRSGESPGVRDASWSSKAVMEHDMNNAPCYYGKKDKSTLSAIIQKKPRGEKNAFSEVSKKKTSSIYD